MLLLSAQLTAKQQMFKHCFSAYIHRSYIKQRNCQQNVLKNNILINFKTLTSSKMSRRSG